MPDRNFDTDKCYIPYARYQVTNHMMSGIALSSIHLIVALEIQQIAKIKSKEHAMILCMHVILKLNVNGSTYKWNGGGILHVPQAFIISLH